MDFQFKIKGRGTSLNPQNRFEKIDYIPEIEELDLDGRPKTEYYNDNTKKLITYNDSPDIPFKASINPYRGCEHGCIYCFARPTHEYLGLSAGLDFETKIFVKKNAARLLKKELNSKKWIPQPVAISGVTDCYQQAENHFNITRNCLEVFLEFKNPIGIVTKNYLVTRDIDILKQLSEYNCVHVVLSITTLDSELCQKMEPRASHPTYRLKAIERLAENGIPVMVLIAPVIPGLNDHEIPKILKKSAEAGATQAGYVMLRLPYGVKSLFSKWLEMHYPDRVNKIMHRIESVRDGKLNSSDYFDRMKGKGVFSDQIKEIFNISCRKYGLNKDSAKLEVKHFKRSTDQMSLF